MPPRSRLLLAALLALAGLLVLGLLTDHAPVVGNGPQLDAVAAATRASSERRESLPALGPAPAWPACPILLVSADATARVVDLRLTADGAWQRPSAPPVEVAVASQPASRASRPSAPFCVQLPTPLVRLDPRARASLVAWLEAGRRVSPQPIALPPDAAPAEQAALDQLLGWVR